MEPLVAWIISAVSALLLAAGGYLLARGAAMRGMTKVQPVDGAETEALREQVARLSADVKSLLEENRGLENQYEAAIAAKEAAEAARAEALAAPPPDAPTPGGKPEDPAAAFYERPSAQLERVATDEFQISKAAPPGTSEFEDEPSSQTDFRSSETTRQFQLNSTESVVEFLQKIDELTDENRQLRKQIEGMQQRIRQASADAGQHAQRRAEVDRTAAQLRQELARRDNKIRKLEKRLYDELGYQPAEPQRITSVTVPAIPADAIVPDEEEDDSEEILGKRPSSHEGPTRKFDLPTDGI